MKWRYNHPLYKKDDGADGGDTPAWASKLLDRVDQLQASLSKDTPKSQDPKDPANPDPLTIPQPKPPASETSESSEEPTPPPKRRLRDFLI